MNKLIATLLAGVFTASVNTAFPVDAAAPAAPAAASEAAAAPAEKTATEAAPAGE